MSEMNVQAGTEALSLFKRMGEAVGRFKESPTRDVSILSDAFHREMVIHQPKSLPYAGDWRGLEGIAAMFRRLGETWSAMQMVDVRAARSGDIVLISCTIHLTCRNNGRKIVQPFAETQRVKDGLFVEGTPFYWDTGEILAVLAEGPI